MILLFDAMPPLHNGCFVDYGVSLCYYSCDTFSIDLEFLVWLLFVMKVFNGWLRAL